MTSTNKHTRAICDSNIWIAYFNKTDNQHDKACQIIERLTKNNATHIITNLIDIECITILMQKTDPQTVNLWLQFQKDTSFKTSLFIDKEDHNHIIHLIETHQNHHLSFVDYSLVYLSQQGFDIYTLDKQLQKVIENTKIHTY